jgi:type II secretory pathway pseudopilin PulG
MNIQPLTKTFLKPLHPNGDTIVEVMVVLAVLGLAVGISFATANRGLLDTSQSEQNSQATNYAQAEVEDLRYLAPTSNSTDTSQNPTSNIFNPAGTFCITDPTSSVPITTSSELNCTFGPTPFHILIYNCDSYTGTSPNPCNGTATASDTFAVVATWSNIQGDGQDSATLYYRAHTTTLAADPSKPYHSINTRHARRSRWLRRHSSWCNLSR